MTLCCASLKLGGVSKCVYLLVLRHWVYRVFFSWGVRPRVGEVPVPRLAEQSMGSWSVSTNSHGHFSIPQQPSGSYQLCASAPGFASVCDPATIVVTNSMVVLDHDVRILPTPGTVVDGCFWTEMRVGLATPKMDFSGLTWWGRFPPKTARARPSGCPWRPMIWGSTSFPECLEQGRSTWQPPAMGAWANRPFPGTPTPSPWPTLQS
jgi:hypothetical protein